MNSFNFLLFDLDGTLTDSKTGIINCFRYALEKMNYTENEITDQFLNEFIGPPLTDSFAKLFHGNKKLANQGVTAYRERFSTIGLFENNVYDGIPDLLESLRNTEKTLCVATSKPQIFTDRILKRYQLADYFDIIVGSNDTSLNSKTLVIEEVLRRGQIKRQELSSCLMIGDRRHDIIGAKNTGIYSMGVKYGYSDPNELEEAGANYIVNNIPELKKFLLSH